MTVLLVCRLGWWWGLLVAPLGRGPGLSPFASFVSGRGGPSCWGFVVVSLALCARVVFFLLVLSCWGFLCPSVLVGCRGLLPRERHDVLFWVQFEFGNRSKIFSDAVHVSRDRSVVNLLFHFFRVFTSCIVSRNLMFQCWNFMLLMSLCFDFELDD